MTPFARTPRNGRCLDCRSPASHRTKCSAPRRIAPCARAQVAEGCPFLGRHMNKSALALAGFGFAAGIVLFIVVEPLLAPEPKAPPAAVLATVAKPSVQQPSAPPPEPFPEARKAIVRTLKDPGSAKFGRLFQGRGMSGNETVCGEVNAKNGFGGYTGMTPFVYFVESDSVELITDPVNERMTQKGITAFFKDCRG